MGPGLSRETRHDLHVDHRRRVQRNLAAHATRSHSSRPRKACVIGAGPNGLAAAIVLAQAGLDVQLFEAEPTVGGAARTMDSTLPGFHHDFGSAVHPMAVGSPFFNSLPLSDYGLEWIHSPAPLAHPFDDGTAIVLERDLATAEAALNEDGPAWRALMQPFVTRWPDLTAEILGPILHIPRHPLLLARFGLNAMQPATILARRRFRTEPTRALFAGLAAHSFLALTSPSARPSASSSGLQHTPSAGPSRVVARNPSLNALSAHFTHLGGRIATATSIHNLADLPACDLTLCDLSPRQLLALAGDSQLTPHLSPPTRRVSIRPLRFQSRLRSLCPDPLERPCCSAPPPSTSEAPSPKSPPPKRQCPQGSIQPARFVLLSQPTLFDPTRAPMGKHVAWAYCHVPHGAPESESEPILDRIEAQIERFATGFRTTTTIPCPRISSPATLEAMDANLIGGDISGGAMNLRQLLFRPSRRQYRTSAPDIYLCSASTPPGGGVHGMCGANAAHLALRRLRP